jgi:redox-sensitive bicupin YhaK (pirin superfamily)
MGEDIMRRSAARISDPPVQRGTSARHRVRELVPSGDWVATDPFLLLMEDWFPRGVFDWHPHRGIETVTYIIDGVLHHEDTAGHSGTVRTGDVQWMTAGRGLVHLEQPALGSTVHSLQLWVNLPAVDKMAEPRYQDLVTANVPVRLEPGAAIRVYSGASGQVVALTKNYVPVTMLEIRLEPGARISQDLPGEFNAFLFVLEGEGWIGSDAAQSRAGKVVWLTRCSGDKKSEVELAASSDMMFRALLFAGRPLHEPVVARGPFVMNTEQQIRQAYADYQFGQFGSPRTERV